MHAIQKDAYIFQADVVKTKAYYQTNSLCKCDACRNFYEQVEGKYPELEAFLAELGVDIARPDELSWYDWNDNKIDYTPCYTVSGTVEQWGQYEIDFDTVVNVVVYHGNDPHCRINAEQTEPYFVLVVYNIFLPWVLDAPFPVKPKRMKLWKRFKGLFRKGKVN